MALPTSVGAAPAAALESKLNKEVNEEYHDPYDDWGARDILLSLVPFIVTFAFRDQALPTALAFAIAWSAILLIFRLVFFHGWRKLVWPVIDIMSVIMFAVLRGLWRVHAYEIVKWFTVIIPLVYIAVAAVSLSWRRPFTAHYARFPKFDKGGRGLFFGDAAFRRTADLTTLSWISVWSVSLLLSLIPILTSHWLGWHVLNVIFNYVTPFVLLAIGLVLQQLLGTWYRRNAGTAVITTKQPYDNRGMPYTAGEPAGTPSAVVADQPTTYTSAV